ncbi:MAG: 3-hydroxyacyl-CoA dehydrogenase [SAR324 cluster bacterium]|nr:3-hydroxyacyl-CoA dehydrogenase [SAR324 cluster bacterium]
MQIESNNYPVAVLGAGTMGEGIAQIAATAGHPVQLYDVSQKQTQAAVKNIAGRLERSVKKEKITEERKAKILANISAASVLKELASAKLVIEAIIEDLAIKQDVFSQLETLLAEDAVLATNTSSIDLNKMGSVLQRPERLVGMHFFNPAPVMALVEVVSSAATNSELAGFVFSLAEQWGKSPVHVRSSPGFIVNRVARPFYSEALKIIEEGGADAVSCDAIMRDCGGFRMGPFELIDLIGLDVNYAVTCQIWESYQRHPRFAPSVLQKELVDSGRLGRKSGQGFFEYGADVEKQITINAPESTGPDSLILEGPDLLPETLRKLIESSALKQESTSGKGVICLPSGAAVVCSNGKSSSERSAELGNEVISLDLCLDYQQSSRIVLAPAENCPEKALQEAVGLFQLMGKQVSVLKDIPGMVLTRTVAMLANEASLLVQEEVADAAGVNLAMRKGVNYPQGPLEWVEEWGISSVVKTLDNLQQVYGERYQCSEWLRQKGDS